MEISCNLVTLEEGIYNGTLLDGLLHGLGKMLYVDGSYYDGEWKAGKQHGLGTYFHSQDQYYEKGFSINGIQVGKWYVYENEITTKPIAVVTYKNGIVVSNEPL